MPDSSHRLPALLKFAYRRVALFILFPILSLGYPSLSRFAVAQSNFSQANIADLSLEELMNIEVTSVSRRTERLSEAAASIFVISSEDIRRSGATTLPEILRLAPNLQVARIDTVQYAITARGFNNTIGNKLLVLLDGRTIYTPMFSGVFWEMQDTVIEDIDRVEVISGPGATLWGANAVNGVINIITKETSDTQGVLTAVDVGDYERGATFRKGGITGNDIAFRFYGKFREFDNTILTDGSDVRNDWKRGQIGFRAGWTRGRQDFTIQGDAYKGESEHRGFVGPIEIPAVKNRSLNLLGRWNRELENRSNVRLQVYWSQNERDEFILFSPKTDLFDMEFQHTSAAGRHNLVWGGGYRHASDEVSPGAFTKYIPDKRSLNWQNVYIQDEFPLSPALTATLGAKLEWNEYTGMEYLPNVRLAWNVSQNHMLWTALSRAVRAPSRFDRDVYFPEAPPFIIAGGPDFESEVAIVAETGYRAQIADFLNYSITAFYHDWDKLRSGTGLPLPAYLVNNIEGSATGLEAWANWRLLDNWVLSGGFSVLDKDLRFKTGTSDTVGVNNYTLHNDPDFQWVIRSSMNLGLNLELDLFLRGVDELTVAPVPAYTELNMRLAWKPADNIEFSITGRNLLHENHPEFGALPLRSVIQQGILLGVKWTPR